MDKMKIKKRMWIIALAISAAVFIFCIYKTITSKGENDRNEFFVSAVKVSSEVDTAEKDEDKVLIPVNFDEIKKENEDIYAWIEVPGTEIDYPLLRSGEKKAEDFYLNHDVNGKSSSYGSIYTQKYNKEDFSDFNTIIYGHNMKDGSMFGTLKKFREKTFFEKNREITIYMPDRVLKYEIFAAYVFDDRHLLANFDFESNYGINQYLKTVNTYKNKYSSNFNEDIKVNAKDKIITLSTCTSNDGERYLVQAVLVSDCAASS